MVRCNLLSSLLSLLVLAASAIACQRLPSAAEPTTSTGAIDAQTEDRIQSPEIAEYGLLLKVRDGLPDLEAVEALRAIIAFRPHSPAAYEAHVSLARHYARMGDPSAEVEYRAAIELESDKGTRLELAGWLEEQGDLDAAYAEFQGLLGEYPQAFVSMRRVGTDSVRVAGDLLAATYYSDALEELGDAGVPETSRLRAQSFSGLGLYDEAIVLYRQWLGQHPQDAIAKVGLARARAQQGDWDEALSLYESIDTADSLLAQAQVWSTQDSDKALALYMRCPYPIAKWEATELLEKEGRFTETLRLYAELAAGQSLWADDAAYRLHVLSDRLQDTAQRAQARIYLKALQPNYLAMRLGEEWTPGIALPSRPTGTQIVSKTIALEAAGLDDLAYRELTMAARFDARREARVTYAQALLGRGYLLDAQRIAEDTLQEALRAPLALWMLAYPRPFEQDVRAAAEVFDLDPLLLWAVMHTESRYDPEALSRARARGLMQLMPSTADWAAEAAGDPYTPIDAYEPEVNIRLGAWYIRWLLDYFDGDLELAVTAYNGGQGSVTTWDAQVDNRDDFFRWIAFGESREYVNRVLTAYHIYQELDRLSPSGATD